MGEVYLAADSELHRNVALKVLPADVSSNQDRMRRFKQEATAAAALNHPNIAHIYEIAEREGTNFIAMEFVAPIANLNPEVPYDLQKIVRRCLAKDPDERYQSIKDVAIELKEVRHELLAGFDTTVPATSIGSTVGAIDSDGSRAAE